MAILRALERRGADPTLPWGSSYIPTNGQIGMTAAGVPMNDDMALTVGTVYTAVAILSDSVSTLPLETFRTSQGVLKPTDPHPLIENPWPEGILLDWLTQVMFSLALRGNFFGRIVDRDSDGIPTMIQPIHPDQVLARRDSTGRRRYWLQGQPCPTEDVLHIPAILPPGAFIGLNPVEYMRSSWGLAAAAERYGGQFFANSANPSGVIEVPEDLSEDETLELMRAWSMAHQGIGRAQYPAVLTGGAKWNQISISPDDAQFLQTRDFQRNEIAGFFRIPAHLMGQQDRTSSWGTGIEQMEIGFVINTLRPWLSRIEGYLSTLLPPGVTCRFNLAGRLRGDTLQRFQSYTLGRNGSWLTINEIRALENLPPVDVGGDELWAPLNFAPVDQMLSGASPNGGPGGGLVNSPTAPPAPNVGFPSGTKIPAASTSAPALSEIRISPVINLSPPNVHVDAPVVHVAPPDVNVLNAPANVTVTPAPVTVMPTARTVRRTVERDRSGQITGTVETEL